MNPLNLIRCVAATLAATTMCAAQAAPAPRARSAAPSTEATERMQVRLAEVIAMLEEEDLTPEQRERAKQKLEEIVTRLRASRNDATPPAPPTPPNAGRVAPRTRVAAPQPPEAPQDPRPAAAPKPPKAPKAPKPSKASTPEVYHVETTPDGAHRLRVVERDDDDDDDDRAVSVRKARVGDVEVRKVQSREDVSAKVKAATEKQRAEGLTLERSRDKVDVRELVDRVRQQSLEASRAATTARKQAEKAQADVKATEKRKAEADQAARAARVYAIGEDGEPREYRAKVERDGTRVYLDYGEGQRVRAYQVPPSRARAQAPAQARVDRANDAGDEEIRELVEEMRREMREIRELLQQLRRQAQATSNRASARGGATGSGGSGQGSSTARGTWSQGRDGFYGAQGGTSAMGGMRGTSTRSGGASGGGMGGTRAPAANSFERLAPAKTRSSSGAQGGFRSLWSTNDDSSGSTLMR